jgi:hypothetical protein
LVPDLTIQALAARTADYLISLNTLSRISSVVKKGGSFSEMTRGLLRRITCNDSDIRTIMELTQDRVTDVVAGFWGKNSDHRLEPLICAQLHNLSYIRRRGSGMDFIPLKSERSRNPGWMSARSD